MDKEDFQFSSPVSENVKPVYFGGGKPMKSVSFVMMYPEALEEAIDDPATLLAIVREKEKDAADLVGKFFSSKLKAV